MVEVYVIGAGMTAFGPQPEAGVHDLAFDAAWAALANAGVPLEKIDIAFAGHAYQGPCFGQKTLMKMGLTGLPIINVENACASGASAVLGVVQAIRSGAAEIGIAIEGERHPNLVETPLFADPLVFICKTPHRLEGRKSVSWADMRDTELIGVSSFMATRVFMDYQLAKRGIRLRSNYEVQHHATAVNLVAAGVGSTILPSSTFNDGDRPGVVKIALTHPVVRRKVVLLRPRHATLSPAASAFWSLTLSMLKTQQ